MEKVTTAYHTFEKLDKSLEENEVFFQPPEQLKETKKFKRNINSYHTFENQKLGLDKSLEEKEVFVPPPEQLKQTKVRRYVFHNDKRQAEAKVKGPIKKCNFIKKPIYTSIHP